MNPTPNIPYPVNALYASIRDAFWEVKWHVQAPDALIGGSFLTAISIACQSLVDVQLPSGQTRPTSLNIETIADSGERKSATDGLVCAPIYAHDQRAQEDYEMAMMNYHADMELWDAINSRLKRKASKAGDVDDNLEPHREAIRNHARAKPVKPRHHRVIFENTTERPLIEALQGEGMSIALVSDEADIVLRSGAMRATGMLNKLWSGASSLPTDRMDNVRPITNPRLTVSLMVQEDIFKDYIRKRGPRTRGSGHFARYLISWPDSTMGYRFATLNEPGWTHLRVFHNRIDELLVAAQERLKTPGSQRTVLTLSQEAKELWVQAQNHMEPNLQVGAPLHCIRDFACKSMEIACRLAALLHYFTQIEGTVISMETLQRALQVVEWYFRSFHAIFGNHHDDPEDVRDARAIWSYLYRRFWLRGEDKASRHQAKKSGPVRKERFENGLARLVMDGQVRTYFHGKEWIQLNPQAFAVPSQLH